MNHIKHFRNWEYKLLQLLFCFNRKKRHNVLNKFLEKRLLIKKKFFKRNMCFTSAYDTPVFVISYNQLSYVKQMVNWLKKYRFTNIHIVDNKSTYKPLLDYLNTSDCIVHHMDKNYGHTVIWSSGQFDDIITKTCYIVSDCDIAPNKKLPQNFVERLYNILYKYPYITKVGFALNIHDLPDTETNKTVKKWENKFWQKEIEPDLYLADIDTTFALYRPGRLQMNTAQFYAALRIAGDMTATHIPWFITETTQESIFYMNTANDSASWTKGVTKYAKKVQK